MIRSGHNFAHATIVELQWHVQNCYLIRLSKSQLGEKHFSQISVIYKTFVKCALDPLVEKQQMENVWCSFCCIPHYNDVIMGAMACEITSLTIVYSTVYFRRRSKKHQNSASLAIVRGIHRWPVNSPHKGPVTRKIFLFDDIIMTLHHEKYADGLRCNLFSCSLLYMECIHIFQRDVIGTTIDLKPMTGPWRICVLK